MPREVQPAIALRERNARAGGGRREGARLPFKNVFENAEYFRGTVRKEGRKEGRKEERRVVGYSGVIPAKRSRMGIN